MKREIAKLGATLSRFEKNRIIFESDSFFVSVLALGARFFFFFLFSPGIKSLLSAAPKRRQRLRRRGRRSVDRRTIGQTIRRYETRIRVRTLRFFFRSFRILTYVRKRFSKRTIVRNSQVPDDIGPVEERTGRERENAGTNRKDGERVGRSVATFSIGKTIDNIEFRASLAASGG